ncbi:MAG: transposon-transfer assisting family protein [Ethanoligenens sp.]
MDRFTIEEINLMCLYNTGTRTGLIDELTAMQFHLEQDETELSELARSVKEKLSAMSDGEFDAIADTLIPNYVEQRE